jgi:acyl-CoA thioesterase I
LKEGIFMGASYFRSRTAIRFGVTVAAASMMWSAASAQVVVSLGASNTKGKGVSISEAYPAQLQGMLQQTCKGAKVINAGVNGDTTGGMLRRLDQVITKDTKVVILQPGRNDERQGREWERAGNILQIKSKLKARGIRVVMMENGMFRAMPQTERAADGQHFTPRGYNLLARRIFPETLAALGC